MREFGSLTSLPPTAQTDADYIQTLPKSELIAFYDDFILPTSTSPLRRKLSMHMKSKLAKVDESVQLNERNKTLEDPIEFKVSLQMSKGANPVKKMEEYMV